MDHGGLIKHLSVLLVFATLWGCSSHSGAGNRNYAQPLSVLETPLSTERAFRLSEHFLEYEKGFRVQIRDLSRGLIVTDWFLDGPERHQITIRVTPEIKGSVISTHLRTEAMDAGRWKDVPSVGSREALFLKDLDRYLTQRSTPSKTP
jgi:hypothetical protein